MTLFDCVSQDVSLTIRGREAWGCCPFHSEKTPSFSVNPDKGVYSCFGCGAKGDLIEYLRRKRGLSFRDAAKLAGKELPESERERLARERAVKESLLAKYYTWYHRTLAEQADLYRELSAELEVAEIAMRAIGRVPELYTQEEKEDWAFARLELREQITAVWHRCEVLTYDRHLQARFAWWDVERRQG